MQMANDKWIDFRNSAEKALSQHKYEDAEQFWLDSIGEAKLQNKRARLITSLLGLFSLYWHLQRCKEALPIGKELLTHYENDLGKDCLNVGIMSKSLAQLNQTIGEHLAAENHFKVAVRILRKSLSVSDPALIDLLGCYATTLKALGRDNEARAMAKLIQSRSPEDFSPPTLQTPQPHTAPI